MLKSDTSKDFERIIEEEHIKLIVDDMDINIPKFFKEITEDKKAENKLPNISDTIVWNTLINEAIEDYEKEAKAYRDFFSEERMAEYEEVNDAKVFKADLKRECPVIRKTTMSKLEELQKWKEDFAYSKPQDLLDTFANFLDFARDYIDKYSEVQYNKIIEPFDFNDISEISDDEKNSLHSVIGTGIITTVLYNINPRVFHKSVKRTLIGMYFLSINIHRKTPSKTSEFVMVDDVYERRRGASSNFKMDHNYWYPYNLFMFYSKYIYNTISGLFKEIGIDVKDEYRYIYVELFLNQIIQLNKEAVKTMLGNDQDY